MSDESIARESLTSERMDAELKAKWLEALRSGEYKKGNGTLRDGGDRYCCLGVLCDLQGLKWGRLDDLGDYHLVNEMGEYDGVSMPPTDFLSELGIYRHIETSPRGSGVLSTILARANDSTTTFDEVIKIIEEFA